MEQNQFEGLEEVEMTDVKPVEEIKELKEYEKLLIIERDRSDFEKAINMIKFGCFLQKEETAIDFNKLEKVNSEKKFKGLYTLYRNIETMEFVFVCPLIENNKGDVDENKAMKPYAYDVLYVETVDEETYQILCKAAKNNLRTYHSVLYKAAFITYFVSVAITLYLIIWGMIFYSQNNFFAILGNIFNLSGPFFIIDILGLPLLLLMSIKYKKFKDQ